jgi:hypothetical protein
VLSAVLRGQRSLWLFFVLLQLLAKTKAVAMLAPMTVRMEVTHVKLRGRLRLGLLLGQEAPGIQ